jgi:DnaJ-domain-containing protein 1
MGIIDRLSDVIRSYLNEDAATGQTGQRARGGDPDLSAAYDELDDFLSGGKARRAERGRNAPVVPEELRPDFAELGVPFGAAAASCKTAYKNLLKIHHPDRHAGHAENMRKATEKSTRINAAYERIEKWRQALPAAE